MARSPRTTDNPELVYIKRPHTILGPRKPLNIEELLAVSLRRLPDALHHHEMFKKSRLEETVFVCFDGHSLVGQHAFRVMSVLEGYVNEKRTLNEQLAASQASGEPWTWVMAAAPQDIAATLYQDIGGAPEDLCKVIWGWQWYESPPNTVRVVFITDGESEIRWLAIDRGRAGITEVHLRPKGALTVGPPSQQTVRMGKMDLYREIQAVNAPLNATADKPPPHGRATMTDGSKGTKLTSKERARRVRRAAYLRAKAFRENDPRYVALKQEAKERRRDAYQAAKSRKKEIAAEQKRKWKEKEAQDQVAKRAAGDAKLMAQVRPATTPDPTSPHQ